ncbi:carboxypeptidase-like regulatory domain-containing protein [Aquimarina hainanensis]|uniref:isocitrate dehydrogenase (NADP(+)) n=1 Tax=Aquimarina hainanensis TaxID=1578017 RepID=A0ABW5NEJ4_9FLAO|nr:TonB-dependent receptor [Aquimarina sp. TRL1]QKX07497.1 TonB-dependent receptor [Aquimarina sp. TRL1]
MRKLITLLFLTIGFSSFSQEKFTLSGVISEQSSNETLIGVNVLFPDIAKGATTNEYGFYSITLPKGNYQLVVSYMGFQDIIQEIVLDKDKKLNFQLLEASESLDEVVITENVERVSIKNPQMSINKLSAGTIKQIPVVLGEADVIKSIVLLPGVTSGGEGASGFNVRGGAADQNLILLDEATIFNSSHLFGFFSVFNPDAIKDLKLYKGGIPARYGGRVSSVLDIYQKEGNSKSFHANGGIGAVSSRLLVEGPIAKEKGAFLAGGRASYAHLFLPLFNNDNIAYFYDLNTKLNYKLNDNNNIFLSGYFGRDIFAIDDVFENTYGNSVLNLRWNHLFSDKLFSNLSLIYSDYYYGLELNFVGFKWDSGIRNFNLKYDLKHYLSDNYQLNYGVNNIYYRFNPGEIKPNSETSGIKNEQLINKYANELGVYLDAKHKISNNLTLQYGVRVSNFTRLGQDELNIYENDNPLLFNETLQIYEEASPIRTESYKRSDRIKTFTNIEPRLALSYAFNNTSSIKASYNRMAQYLHLLSNTNSPTPLDVWTPSGKYVKPQLLDQYALGYFKSIKDNDYSLETEVFYKEIKNRIDYIDGAELIANNAIEQDILNGEARAYGWEVLIRKNEGNLKGWIAYTLSKSEQRTPGRTAVETGVNNGNWYNTPYDKTHDISINGSYEINKKWKFGANFIFQTGQPTNYPSGQFDYKGLIVPIYDGARNNQRLPSYHRVDISATLTPRKNNNRKWKGEWVFSIYNVYDRKNAASISFGQNDETLVNEAIKTSIFGIVPAVTYNFKF